MRLVAEFVEKEEYLTVAVVQCVVLVVIVARLLRGIIMTKICFVQ